MKILEISKFYYIEGGTDSHFLDLTKLLKENGEEVAVFSMDHPENKPFFGKHYLVSRVGYREDSSFAETVKGIFRIFYSLEAKKKIREALDDFQPDVVHIHNAYHQISFSILAEIRKRKIPIVMTAHDYELVSPDREKYFEEIGKQYWKYLFCSRFTFPRRLLLVLKSYWYGVCGYRKMFDFFITPSQITKDILIKSGIAAEKIAVFPHPISSALEKSACENISTEKKSDDLRFFYFGRISKIKGIYTLFSIFDNLQGAKLFVAGREEEFVDWEKHPNVEFLGFLEKERLFQEIKKSEVVISASRISETFGLVAQEAIAFGKPFLSFDSGAFHELIENGKNGFICQNEEEMKKIIEKIIQKEIVFNNAAIQAETLQKYSREKYYQKLLVVFKLLIDQKREWDFSNWGKLQSAWYFVLGGIVLILNKIRYSLFGYSNPRGFSEKNIARAVEYDKKVVASWLGNLNDYCKKNFGQNFELSGKSVLELGPGPDLGIGMKLLDLGAEKYTAFDVNNLLSLTPEVFYEKMLEEISEQNRSWIAEELKKNVSKKSTKLDYWVDENFDLKKIPSASVDCFFSQAAFEHFDDVENVIQNLSRIAKLGAVFLAEIDLMTHTGFLKHKDPLNIYRYPDFFYEMMKFKGSPNRMRTHQYVDILQRNGWENIQILPQISLKNGDYLRFGMNPKFLALENEMRHLSVIVVAIKK